MQVVRIVASTGARWPARQEAAVLVAVLVVMLALFGFVKIAEELGEGELAKLDEWLLELLRVSCKPHHPIGLPWLMEAAQDITVLGGRTMLLAVRVFATGYLVLERKYGAIWLIAVAAGGGGVLSSVMKQLITVALFAPFVVGISRVYLGVHYPSDVLAGRCAGLVLSLICWLVARYLQYRGTVERSGRI
jgi:undecaprenyl-diphosphatase